LTRRRLAPGVARNHLFSQAKHRVRSQPVIVAVS
jgi:hypothetical protein